MLDIMDLTIHDDVGHGRWHANLRFANAARMEQLWEGSIGSTWWKEGAVYRGEPPQWSWSDRARAAATPAGKLYPDSQAGMGPVSRHNIQVAGCAFGAVDLNDKVNSRESAN